MFKPAKSIGEFKEKFIIESNAIEGIYREPTKEERDATYKFLVLDQITIADLQEYVRACQPDAVLRDKKGLNVRIGSYYPPKGGKEIRARLSDLLEFISANEDGLLPCFSNFCNYYRENFGNAIDLLPNNPFECHRAYEQLHPFTDCNGRSGRIIWLWQMLKLKKNLAPLGFLQSYYYQSLR